VDEDGAPTVEDRIIEVNRATGRVVNKWDLTTILDPGRSVLVNDPVDWLHNNGIAYSAQDDTIIVSGRHQGVAKINQAGSLVWLLSPRRGWQGAEASRLLTAVDASSVAYADAIQDGAENVDGGIGFDWPWGQHSPSVLPSGDIMLFDNGFNRHFDPNSAKFSRAVMYHIDEGSLTVRQDWQYGATRGVQYFASIISSAKLLPTTGNILIQPGITGLPGAAGSAAVVSEVPMDGGPVFEARVEFTNRHATGSGWGGFDMSYRASRLSW